MKDKGAVCKLALVNLSTLMNCSVKCQQSCRDTSALLFIIAPGVDKERMQNMSSCRAEYDSQEHLPGFKSGHVQSTTL